MRTLSAALLAAQITGESPTLRVVLTMTGETTYVYTGERVKSIEHPEQDDIQTALIELDNSDNVLTALDLGGYDCAVAYGHVTGITISAWQAGHVYSPGDVVKPTTPNGYQYRCTAGGTSHATTEPTWANAYGTTITDGTVTWTFDGEQGSEYSECAPLKVVFPMPVSSHVGLSCFISCAGKITNRLSESTASENYDNTSSGYTAKGYINQILSGDAGALACFAGETGITVSWDSEAAIVDTYVPAGDVDVSEGDSRMNLVKTLCRLTGQCFRPENDGELHFIVPTSTGTTYDYQYTLADGGHIFFNKSYRKTVFYPNKITVKSNNDAGYEGSATDAYSYGKDPCPRVRRYTVSDNTQATAIAQAEIDRMALDAERGTATVPLNCGQEVWDYIKFTDVNEGGQVRTGNVQRLTRRVNWRQRVWRMELTLGKPGMVSTLGTTAPAFTESSSGVTGGNYATRDQVETALALLDLHIDDDSPHLNMKSLALDRLTVKSFFQAPGRYD